MDVMRPVLSFNPLPINHTELAGHLAVERSSLPQIVGQFGLTQASGRNPWPRIWRTIHRIEGTLLAGHLAHLRRLHASPILDGIDDLAIALTAPLMTFSEMAQVLGSKPDTLSRALREKRIELPIPVIQLGPRLRRYRPLEVFLWRDENMLLDLPTPVSPHPMTTLQGSPGDPLRQPSATFAAQPSGTTPRSETTPTSPQKALFGTFARNSRPSGG